MTKKNDTPTEYYEACKFVDWLEQQKQIGGVLDYCHIANESYGRTKADLLRGQKLRRQGRKPGVFDYEIFVYTNSRTLGDYIYVQELRVELKRQKGGRVSDAQMYWLGIYRQASIPVAICKGADEAIAFVKQFLPYSDHYMPDAFLKSVDPDGKLFGNIKMTFGDYGYERYT